MVREEVISVLLGYASICCWLGAQFPQIVVNWRRSSVDGLALPFLISWFFGDSTNLIGCLLTDQLPFQTYLATYFVFVDFCLITQYFYYDAPRNVKSLSDLTSSTSRTSLLLPYSAQPYTLPHANLSRSRSRSYSTDPHLGTAVASLSLATAELEGRWRGRGRPRAGSLGGLPESIVADLADHGWEARRIELRDSEADHEAFDAESESAPSIMVDSFHSEGGRGRGKHVSWHRDSASRDRDSRRLSHDPVAYDPGPEPSGTTPSTVRGRQLTRPIVYDSPVETEALSAPSDERPRPRRTSTTSSISAGASRRGAGIVFVGVFALFGLSSQAGYRMRREVQGGVLSAPPSLDVLVPGGVSSVIEANPTFITWPSAVETPIPSVDRSFQVSAINGDTQRLIGRVSAWICTTLYITSRLPQIWKNFARKSVEGLSMYLFVFAFLGNFFYVLSILASPKMDLPAPRARQFLRDSVPYLLGSGGTLLFDVTIVLQSFVYAGNRRTLWARNRRKSLVVAVGEEERGLLAEGDRE